MYQLHSSAKDTLGHGGGSGFQFTELKFADDQWHSAKTKNNQTVLSIRLRCTVPRYEADGWVPRTAQDRAELINLDDMYVFRALDFNAQSAWFRPPTPI